MGNPAEERSVTRTLNLTPTGARLSSLAACQSAHWIWSGPCLDQRVSNQPLLRTRIVLGLTGICPTLSLMILRMKTKKLMAG